MLSISDPLRALFINGTVGAGKTTAATHVADLLEQRGIPYTVIDLDWLHQTWPAPADDPFNLGLELRNLAAMCSNAAEAGSRLVCVAGVLADKAVRPRYEQAIGAPLTVVRLAVEVSAVEARLRGRHDDPDLAHHREWHLKRAGELDAILRGAEVDDHVIEVGMDGPRRVAERILATCWPGLATEQGQAPRD